MTPGGGRRVLKAFDGIAMIALLEICFNRKDTLNPSIYQIPFNHSALVQAAG
jgi:hypothetical protein